MSNRTRKYSVVSGRRNGHSTQTLFQLYAFYLTVLSRNKSIDFSEVTKKTISDSKPYKWLNLYILFREVSYDRLRNWKRVLKTLWGT